jgi:hypothetical protein
VLATSLCVSVVVILAGVVFATPGSALTMQIRPARSVLVSSFGHPVLSAMTLARYHSAVLLASPSASGRRESVHNLFAAIENTAMPPGCLR